MQHLRLGIIGCGEVTQIMHLPALAQLPGLFRVTALCDLSRQVMEGLGKRLGVELLYQDYHDLLACGEVDAVLVANPTACHAETVLAALAAGRHVLVEKPMCITTGEADALIAAQAQSGCLVQVGYMRRYAPAFLEACRLLPELGPVRLARVHDLIGTNPLFTGAAGLTLRGDDLPADGLARLRQRHDERVTEAIGAVGPDLQTAYNILLGLGSHDLSAMRELLGMPKRVLAATARHGGLYLTATFDYGDFACQYETGVDQIPRFDAHLEVFGRERVMRVQYDTPYIRNLPVRLVVTAANGQGGVTETREHPSWGDPFTCEWQAFHANIVENRQPKTSPADFRQDLELFQKMLKAMQG